jgi:hypothetical protein
VPILLVPIRPTGLSLAGSRFGRLMLNQCPGHDQDFRDA